jgi:hypothetical protein
VKLRVSRCDFHGNYEEKDPNQCDTWICDSGACGHYCNSDKYIKDIDEKITVRNAESMKATKVGSLKYQMDQLDGSSDDITLKYLSELCRNLFIIIKALKNRFHLSNKGLMISLKKESASVTFDRVIKTVNASISGIKMITYDPSVAYIFQGNLTSVQKIDGNMFQELTGNCGVDCLQKTAKVHGLKLQGEFEVCEDRAAAKASQKSVIHD